MSEQKEVAADANDVTRTGAWERDAQDCVEIVGKIYLPASTLAKVLNVNLRTLARWDDARIGPPKIKIGRMILYDADKIPDWMAQHENRPVRLAERGATS